MVEYWKARAEANATKDQGDNNSGAATEALEHEVKDLKVSLSDRFPDFRLGKCTLIVCVLLL